MPCGWAGKILYIDLSDKTVALGESAPYKDFIGGRGINQYLLFKNSKPGTDPLNPLSVVVLGAGPLVGTLVPGADRLSVDFKNVITGGVGSGNCGGQFAAEMKYAGYDHIVIGGKADKPVYIYIADGDVHFRDAAQLWGRDTWQTDIMIKRLEDDKSLKTLTIGPGGENQVKFSCIIGDRGRAVGYGGSGAVFGSKNLKAIAVRGTQGIGVADPRGFTAKLRDFNRIIEKNEHISTHRAGGTLLAYLKPGQNRPHGVRNMSDDFWGNEAIACVSRDEFDRHLKRRHSCFGCPVFCSGIYEINGLKCEGVQANTLRAFGTNLDLRSPEKVLTANALANMYGLDVDQTSAAIAWAMECYDNDILSKNDLDGLELTWGNGDNILKIIEKIAFRKGIGDVLAEGVYEASKIVGRGSGKFTALVKKNSVMEAAMRTARAWALGVVTSTKGTGHLRGAPAIEMKRIPPGTSKRLFGIDDISDPRSYHNKGKLVAWQEAYKAVVDCMGICALITIWMDTELFTPDDIADFYRLVTGEEARPGELLITGEKIQNIERVFNLLHAGFDRKDDMPPDKFVRIPVSNGPFKGDKIDIVGWNAMLDEYYACHNWDIQTGRPTRKHLVDLGLGDIAEAMGEGL
ncbi:MAG TPA: aldehyde ferredoxin oxidoreductase C-terminal domain-containing protein [Clostridia bacterium]|nr:aldehyde ferredoxin oxidoreductase C-terminal domain-containing protein [Clostridia bacterium]